VLPTEVLALAREDFHELVQRAPEILRMVAATVAGRRAALAGATLARARPSVDAAVAPEQQGVVSGSAV